MSSPPETHRIRPPPRRVLSDIPEPKQKSGIGGAVFNLTNVIVGSGIIGIPFTVKESGLIMGMLLLILVAYLAVRSLRIIVETASFHPKLKMVGVKTYEDLMFMPFGYIGSMFILISKFIFAYGSMVAYLLIIKDTVPVVLGLSSSHVNAQIIMVVASLVVVLPLSLLRDVASLACTSFLSISADVVLVIFMIIYSPVAESVNAAGGFLQVLKHNSFNSHLFIGLGIISQAMTCHPVALIISGSLNEKSSSMWGAVTRYSVGIAWFLCSIMGIVGFLGFLDETQGDILNNFEEGSVAANSSRGLVAITMIFTYPMQALVARHVIAKIFFNGDSEGDMIGPEGERVPAAKLLWCIGRREKLTLSIYVATLIPALILDDLGPVLSITGAVGGSCLAYIGPGLIYLGAYGEDFMEYTDEMMGKGTSNTDPALELPVVGDSKATMEDGGTISTGGSTPCWWYFVLMPVWRAIASRGSIGMKIRLEQLEEESPGCTTVPPSGEIVGPIHGTYYLAMFMIAFGIVALVLGIASNVIVHVLQ